MSEQVKKFVPKLRFPEFKSAGEWVEIKLIDTVDKKIRWSFIGGPFGSNLKSSDYVASGIRVIQLQNIGDAQFLDNYKIFTSEEKANELLSNNIYPGDIILSKMGDPVGRACLIPNTHDRYVMCSDGIRLKVDEKKYSKYFVYSLINDEQFRSLVEKTATGSTRKRIGLDDLKNIPMRVPREKNEQQKIADCLSSLDDLITAQNHKVEALKQHKKGLMQQFFPAEGETAPKLRFPEFESDGEWQPRKLSEIVTPVVREVNKPEANYLALGIRSHGKGTFHKPDQAPEKNSMDKLYLVNKDDLIVNITFAWEGAIAIAKEEDHGTHVSHRFPTYSFNEKVSSSSFFQHVIINKSFIYKLGLISPGGAGRNRVMNKSDFLKISVLLPSPDEQERISKCLSSLDDAISSQTQKLEALKAHKKGLMQQLFPSVNEVEK